MREFIDLNLKAKSETLQDMLMKAASLGFTKVGVDVDCVESGLDIVSRVNLAPRNVNELSRDLKKYRRRVEIISVQCNNIKVARQAAKDHRVDIISFPEYRNGKRRVWLDRQEANLASGSNIVYEFLFSDLLGKSDVAASKVIHNWGMELSNARKHDIPVIVSSGACSVYELREPRALASMMVLLEVDEDEALDMVSTTPLKLVERNRRKLDSGYVAPGVRVV